MYPGTNVQYYTLSIYIYNLCIYTIVITGMVAQGLAKGYWMLVFMRAFSGLFAPISGVVQSYISDICDPIDLPKYTAKTGIVFGLVWGLGPVGAVLVSKSAVLFFKNEVNTNNTFKYRFGFIVAGSIVLISFILAYFKLKESLPKDQRTGYDKSKDSTKEKLTKLGINQDKVELITVIDKENYYDVILNIQYTDEMKQKLIEFHVKFSMKNEDKPLKIANDMIKNIGIPDSLKWNIVKILNEIGIKSDIDYDGINDDIINDDSNVNYFEICKTNDYLAEIYSTLYIPKKEQTKKFKKRLKYYIIIILICVVFVDMVTTSHMTIYALFQDGKHNGLNWSSDQFAFTWMIYGLSFSSCQLFFVKLLNKIGPYNVLMIGSLSQILACILIPITTKSIINSNVSNMNNIWLQVILHIPCSLFHGMGYGICSTASQYIISDYAKRIDIRSVSFWLGCFVLAEAFGCSSISILSIISGKIGPANTFYVCGIVSGFISIIYGIMNKLSKDIKMVTDVKAVIKDELTKITEERETDMGHSIVRPSIEIEPESDINIEIPNVISPNITDNVSASYIQNLVKQHHDRHSQQTQELSFQSSPHSQRTSFKTSVSELMLTERSSFYSSPAIKKGLSNFSIPQPMGLPVLPPAALIGVPLILNDNTNIDTDKDNENTTPNNNEGNGGIIQTAIPEDKNTIIKVLNEH